MSVVTQTECDAIWNLLKPPTVPKLPWKIETVQCCGEDMSVDATGAFSLCWDCGKALPSLTFPTPSCDYEFFANIDGPKVVPRMNRPTAKRVTHPISNFRDIYLQFLGQTSSPAMPSCLIDTVKREVDVYSYDAYSQIRAILKKRKPWRRHYRDIFRILYQCGGTEPKEAAKHWRRIRVEYLALCDYFERNRAQLTDSKGKMHKSMFSTWMMLSFILTILECPSSYELPRVKDTNAGTMITGFLERYRTDVLQRRSGIDVLNEYKETGIWLA